MTPIPMIQTARLNLRGFALDDFMPLYEMVSDRETVRYFPRTEPWPLEVVQRWMARQAQHWDEFGFGWWAVEQASAGAFMGWCGLNVLKESDEVEVLYLLGKQFWGQGYAAEGARHSVEYGFARAGRERIIGLTHLENFASQRVLEKAGLVFSNTATYFGMDCRRYSIDRARYDEFYTASLIPPPSASTTH